MEARHQALHSATRRRPWFRAGQDALGGRAHFRWLHQFKRLRTRYERRSDLHLGLLQLACCVICLRRLSKSRPSDQAVGPWRQ
ncbi:hypothetical protein SAM23877_0588 [Streptomyces ambofaciens ATCC 23877]|uniref:Transposase n=1 Tax=Streptomyces ambofaciens (strain ATCC 23877 / 3486 / DSM 40053 / JCM 4204 / NBRC 12836 / NRRL B-2516) TaxID=278992 RepID=A0A0K2ALB2_STRA7|nr:hypothetical protein SAM23877_0588 [Streptomyces ambofaciens ATCC 23877]